MISILAPIFRGQWARYGEALVLDSEVWDRNSWRPGLSVEELLADAALLKHILRRYANLLGCADIRPAASIWTLRYFEVLFPPVIAAAALLEHEFPVATHAIWPTLDENAEPQAFHIRRLGRSLAGGDVHARYAALIWEHLSPLIEHLAACASISPRLLWANAARRLETILDILIENTGSTAIAHDREALLHQNAWPGRARNPLFGEARTGQRLRDGRLVTIPLHRQCCLYFRAPPYHYCGACPIPPEKRRPASADLPSDDF